MRLVIVAVFLTAIASDVLARPNNAFANICSDRVKCGSGCITKSLPDNECFPLDHNGTTVGNGDTWMCNNITRGPCFLLRKYPAGSGCAGAPISSRANFCDECKGEDPVQYQHMQHRRCNFSADGSVSSVSYYNCAGENGTISCVNCDDEPQGVYPAWQCVTNSGFDWRLEWSLADCPLMLHVNYRDVHCKDFWWGDRIVLGQCNDGWQFECPGI